MPVWRVMPLWTTMYLRGEDRQRILAAVGIQEVKEGQWSEADRRAVHSYVISQLRSTLVQALRDYCKEPSESEEQILLTACYGACNRGPNSIINANLYQVPMQASLSELRRCIGEEGYDEAIGLMGREKIYEEILGGILLEDSELQRFMAGRFPEPLV